jgi:hypothetical protein
VSALYTSLVAPQSDPHASVPEVQEPLLGSPSADRSPSEESSQSGEGAGCRRSNRYGHRNSRAPVLRERVEDASRAEGSGTELGRDGARAPTAVRDSFGQRPTEGPGSITIIGPCPPPSPGQGRIRVAGRGELQRAGLEGCWKAGSMLPRTRAATPRDAGGLTRDQRRTGGVGRLPRFVL